MSLDAILRLKVPRVKKKHSRQRARMGQHGTSSQFAKGPSLACGSLTRKLVCRSRLRLALLASEIDLRYSSRSFGRREVCVIHLEAHARGEQAGRELLHVRVVILQG